MSERKDKKNQDMNSAENKKSCCCGSEAVENECSEGVQCASEGTCKCESEGGCGCQGMPEDAHTAFGEVMLQLAKATEAADKNRDLYMRTVADFDTYKRKVVREKEELAKYAVSPIIEDMIPCLDALLMAVTGLNGNEATKGYADGISMVNTQIKKVLENHGMKQINPLGEDFDPNLHEAVAHQPSKDFAENKIMMVVRIGYSLNGRLIRPATVVVSKGDA